MTLGTNCQVPGTNVVLYGTGYKLSGARDKCGATWLFMYGYIFTNIQTTITQNCAVYKCTQVKKT